MLPSLASLRVGHGGNLVGAGLAPSAIKSWSRAGVPTEVKRDKDGRFVLTPKQLQDLMSQDIEDVELSLRGVWKSMRAPPAPKPASTPEAPPEDYAVPKFFRRGRPGVSFSNDLYMIEDSSAARIYLKYTAAETLLNNELEAFYDTQIQGRMRWTVRGTVSIGNGTAPGSAARREIDTAVFLQFLHQAESDAILEAATTIERTAKRLLDDWLRAQG